MKHGGETDTIHDLILQKLNHNKYILSLYYYYRLIFSPCISIISPITFLLIPYILIKKLYNINIGFRFEQA